MLGVACLKSAMTKNKQQQKKETEASLWDRCNILQFYDSDFFLFFFRKEGVRNFFFFLEGDLLGDSSPSWSPASTGSSPSAASVVAGAGVAASSAGSAGASEGSSGVKSGRVCLRVAGSLSSLKVCSGTDSDGGEDEEKVIDLRKQTDGSDYKTVKLTQLAE